MLASAEPCRVLFLCTGNSARSIPAEALLNRLGGGALRRLLGGLDADGAVNPPALAPLAHAGLPTEGLRSKSRDEFAGPGATPLDFIFTVCENAAAEVCPVWLGTPISAHGRLPDPAAVEGSHAEIAAAFAEALRMLRTPIGAFVSLPRDSLDRMSLQQRLRDIGARTEIAQ